MKTFIRVYKIRPIQYLQEAIQFPSHIQGAEIITRANQRERYCYLPSRFQELIQTAIVSGRIKNGKNFKFLWTEDFFRNFRLGEYA